MLIAKNGPARADGFSNSCWFLDLLTPENTPVARCWRTGTFAFDVIQDFIEKTPKISTLQYCTAN